MKTVRDMGEDALVSLLTRGLPAREDVVTGAGDDCAVVRPVARGWLELLKTDCLVEGVHFLRSHAAEQVGWKAMARVVSDIASMAGEPRHALVTLILPPDVEVAWVEKLYLGLVRCAELFGIAIAGGETSSGRELSISVALTGQVRNGRQVTRDGALAGDAIMVTGRLGGSLGGRHLTFIPRVVEAAWLAQHAKPHAMMDLSDGLAKDLPRMAAASGVDFVVDADALPVSTGCTARQAWSDGEDYELLFAIPARTVRRVESAWSQQFPDTALTRIGRFVPQGHGEPPPFPGGGWDHFAVTPT